MKRALLDPSWDLHCAEFAAERVCRATGRDVWAELGIGGPPRSWRKAADLYRAHGVRSLAELVTTLFGAPIDPKLAMRGDIVMSGWALGICRGELAEFLDRMLSMKSVTVAWRVAPTT